MRGMMRLALLGVPGARGGADTTAPTVEITSATGDPVWAFPITITFSEPVVGFVAGDVTVGNGTLSDFTDSGDATVFTAIITPTADGVVTVDIAAGVCEDAAGNKNEAAAQLTRTASERDAYAAKLRDMFGDDIIGYYPLWEEYQALADDYSAADNPGVYPDTGITYGADGIGDGRTSVTFDGTTYVDLKDYGLLSDFSGSEGTLLMWVKISAETWADATSRGLFEIEYNASNQIEIYKHPLSGGVIQFTYASPAGQKQVNYVTTTTDWLPIALTWSVAANEVRCYALGAQTGSTLTGVSAWAAAPARAIIGGVGQWRAVGSIAHVCLLKRAATPTEIAAAAVLPVTFVDSVAVTPVPNVVSVADGGDINAAIATLRRGDTLQLASGGSYTQGAGSRGFSTLPSGFPLCPTTVDGRGATITSSTSETIGIALDGKSYIAFNDLTLIDGSVFNCHIRTCHHITLTDCNFQNVLSHPFYDVFRITNSDDITVTRCTATTAAGRENTDGFEVWGPCNRVIFTDCVAYNINPAVVSDNHGFEVYGQTAGEICDDIQFNGCEAYGCVVGFSAEGGSDSLAVHTNVVCDGCSSHDNESYGYQGVNGATLYRKNVASGNNTGNGVSETNGSVTDLS